ncbi:MAG: NnrT protein [Rhodobacteraceae bacterium]|nr:MAG: NnrT protein [Paracoccaceae bacterium]
MNDSWSRPKLTLVLYPFGAGAAAVNVFFASLITSWLGWPVLSPLVSIAIGMVLGLPLTYAFACHIQRLMQQ